MIGERVRAPLGRRAVRVTGVETVGAYAVLHIADPDGPRPAPGQFYMLAAAHGWGAGEDERPFLPRAFSHLRVHTADSADRSAPPHPDRSAPPHPDRSAPGHGQGLSFILEDVGPGTHRLAELAEGDDVWLLGPLGNGFAPARSARRPILVGGGVGIAPIAALADDLGAAALVLLGFRDEAHAQATALLPQARLATDDGARGHRGFVTDLLRAELGCDARAEVYACGPPPMLEAVRALCAELDVPAQLAMESGMACGFGACFGCVVPTTSGLIRLCLEGPVLDAAELEEVWHP